MSEAAQRLEEAEVLLAKRFVLEAKEHFDIAERRGAGPDRCAAGRWTCYMLLGEYELAWQQSDAIRARGGEDAHRVWDGAPLAGRRVMIRCVHGFGDAVQMLRYMPLVKQQASEVMLQVAPRLAELARCAPGIDEVIEWEQERAYDVQLEITELPYVFRTTLVTLPAGVPYLESPRAMHASKLLRRRKESRPRVGLVWTGGAWDRTRFLPFDLVAALTGRFDHIDFWSLQAPADNQEWRQLSKERGWGDRCSGEDSPAALAEAAMGMDLIITIDSLAAHLGGALARPVWVLLKKAADWRWMTDRSDSPWYPTMRLFRQGVEGDWRSIMNEATAVLSAWSAH